MCLDEFDLRGVIGFLIENEELGFLLPPAM